MEKDSIVKNKHLNNILIFLIIIGVIILVLITWWTNKRYF